MVCQCELQCNMIRRASPTLVMQGRHSLLVWLSVSMPPSAVSRTMCMPSMQPIRPQALHHVQFNPRTAPVMTDLQGHKAQPTHPLQPHLGSSLCCAAAHTILSGCLAWEVR